MTKFGMAALAALALAAATLATPALASAAPASEDELAAVNFDVTSGLNVFGFKRLVVKCRDYNGGKYPYLAFDRKEIVPRVTYFTGDGEPIGHYVGDITPTSNGSGPIASNQAITTVSPHHGTVTFFCAKTKHAANQ